MNKKNEYQDEGLKGNEKNRRCNSCASERSHTGAAFAHTLTVIRRRMKEGGQLIVAVGTAPPQQQKRQQAVMPGRKIWWSAFTSFEEELKGADQVKSTFLSEIGRMFEARLTVPEIAGLLSIPGTGQSCWINI